jgi:nitroimidazol reductase NimA-like FMN-containing flavoprotein (pyridoxamine 5'-phosphate oxidase superfamily)
MADKEPVAELDARFSIEGATPTDWAQASARLEDAQVYWLSTVRPDGRPHVTPLLSVWLEEALYFCTGPTERKAKNLEHNPHCALTTGTNILAEGLDLVVEGNAEQVRDDDKLQRIADAYESKYGSDWHFDVRDGAFHGDGGEALVFEVAPSKAFGFGKGAYSQTRWRF